ncbi:MAG TPA: hypothetical protein VNO70_08645 [Blastocatellia bacterium]|nr:hypothetical protein [Blastocatellia bacterium]
MLIVAGIFRNSTDAQRAVERLKSIGIEGDRINLLIPGNPQTSMDDVPTTDAEQTGVGAALGGVVGGALGAAGGLHLGAAAASLLVPGVGPVMAFGVLGAAILGAVGAVGGAVAADAVEDRMNEGLPADEVFVYEDALRQGRTVLIAQAEDDEQADAAREALAQSGAESVDAARENWWIGLRDAEREGYMAEGLNFDQDEADYRRGFEAAQDVRARGKSYQEAGEYLAACHAEVCRTEAFRRGYERGRAYYDRVKDTYRPASRQAESGKK